MRIICTVVLWFLLMSCNEEASEIGSDFFQSGQLDISYIDSATVKMSTVQLDPYVTNDASRVLIGYHQDAKLGDLDAAAFFQVSLNSPVDLRSTNSSFQYATLTLKTDGYSYYDTTSHVTFDAWLLNEAVSLSDDGNLYNNDSFSYSNKLGSLSFQPKPHKEDSIEIPLAPAFGNDLYQRCITAHSSVQSNDEFIKYIKGFSISGDSSSSGAILGFDPSIELRLYFIDKSTTPSRLTFLSFPAASSYFSNYIQTDKSETKIAGAKSLRDYVESDVSDDESYLQGGAALALRIEFPYLRSLNQFSNFSVTKAVLELWPSEDSYDSHTSLESEIMGYEVDHKNSVLSATTYTAYFREDKDLSRDTHYELDVTSFVRYQMGLQELNNNALLLTFDTQTLQESVNRVYIASPEKNTKTKLRIYYATISQ